MPERVFLSSWSRARVKERICMIIGFLSCIVNSFTNSSSLILVGVSGKGKAAPTD